MTCQAKEAYGGGFCCEPCNLSWDAGELKPDCRRKHECAVCQGEAGPVTVDRFQLCEDPRCADIAKQWMTRKPDGSTYWEAEARKVGGRAGGEFLLSIGRTDLRKLTKDQYAEYVKRVVDGYRAELRRQGHFCAPPF